MNETPVDSLAWSPRKLGVAIVVAVAAQLGLILWFSTRGELQLRVADVRPAIKLLVDAPGNWLALTDPTLFSRAHPYGFSGTAWLKIPPHSYIPPEKGDAPMWLALAPESMGAAFHDFVRSYNPDKGKLRTWQPPDVTAPSRPFLTPAFDSRVEVQGPLAARGIIIQPELPAWTNADILAPSRVQVLVDARGNPISAVLLGGSGLKAADQSAVETARRMSFGAEEKVLADPASGAEDGLATGWLTFFWRTLGPVTNGLVVPPP
jgi:hypothetical protein